MKYLKTYIKLSLLCIIFTLSISSIAFTLASGEVIINLQDHPTEKLASLASILNDEAKKTCVIFDYSPENSSPDAIVPIVSQALKTNQSLENISYYGSFTTSTGLITILEAIQSNPQNKIKEISWSLENERYVGSIANTIIDKVKKIPSIQNVIIRYLDSAVVRNEVLLSYEDIIAMYKPRTEYHITRQQRIILANHRSK